MAEMGCQMRKSKMCVAIQKVPTPVFQLCFQKVLIRYNNGNCGRMKLRKMQWEMKGRRREGIGGVRGSGIGGTRGWGSLEWTDGS
ncbi:hypothetical protein GUJ93_ZPchr0006g45810 [Zizania palustris]|uniref:Uncharacterized protein n=1 Tax=Zizania palustris TaxID=103762 RepID=A0A8J5VIW4_ZIZPA|nr:hypothetical protein GUJ93_ZPchr0006g45810 [Zizania palustris]